MYLHTDLQNHARDPKPVDNFDLICGYFYALNRSLQTQAFWSVCRSSKQDLLYTSIVFKTRFAFPASGGHQPSTQRNKHSKQDLFETICVCLFLLEGWSSTLNTKKQRNKNNNKKRKKESGCQGQMLQGSHLSDEAPGKHDDIVLVQLVLTHSG